MKYSIIVATYNRGKKITSTIDNLLKVNDCEVIVVNNGVGEENIFLYEHKRVKNIITSEKGVSNARNIGFEKSKGDWIFSFDDDDFLTEEYIDWLNNNEIEKDKINIYRFNVDVKSDGKYMKKYYNHRGRKINSLNKWYTCTSASYLLNNKWFKNTNIKYPVTMTWGEDMVWDGEIRGTGEYQKTLDISSFIYIKDTNRDTASSPKKINYSHMLFNIDQYKKSKMFLDWRGRGYLSLINLLDKAITKNDIKESLEIKRLIKEYIRNNKVSKILKDMPPYDKIAFLIKIIFKKY